MSTIPYDLDNPHHLRCVRMSEKPCRTSSKSTSNNDISSTTSIIGIFDEVVIDDLEDYVDRLQYYANEIEIVGSAANQMAAEEIGGDNLAYELRRHGLLSSPLRNEHNRMKACAEQLAIHTNRNTKRPLDVRRVQMCEKLKLYTGLLR